MDIFYQIFFTFLIGVIASVIGAIAGGGGLISIPFLMFLGLPPQVAIATNKLGAVGLSVGAIYKFWKEKKIIWKFAIPFSVLAVIGGLIGAKLLLVINQEILSEVIGIILLLLLPLIFIKKEIGIQNIKTTKLQKLIGVVFYFLLMVFGGFFGGGAGTLIIYSLMFFMGLTIIEANATDIVPWFVLSLSSLVFFMINGIVDYYTGIALFLGMLIGVYLGARIAIKKGDGWVKIIFAIVVVISSIKILFF